MKGFFITPRAVLETKWWREAPLLARAAWVELMSRANFSEGRTARGENLRPGMLVTSWRALAQALAWKEKRARVVPTLGQTRWALDYLRRYGEVSWKGTGSATGVTTGSATGVERRSATGGGLVVTLERWAFHQSAMGSPTGVGRRSATGVTTGSTTGSYNKGSSRKTESTPKTLPHTPLPRSIDSLREEITLQRAELERVVSNGGEGKRWRELQVKIIENWKLLADMENEQASGKGASS